MIELDDRSREQYGAKIKVVGVGGGGGNAVNTMVERGLQGCEFIVANTDLQALAGNLAPVKSQIGKQLTRGLGAGANPTVGRSAAEEDTEEIRTLLSGTDMVFITAGMGGGTGTGAAPVIAEVARSMGALVVAVVTRPFEWEGPRRAQQAEEGIKHLKNFVDTLIVVPNQKLLAIIEKKTGFREAFMKVDDVLYNATRGIAEIITGHGLINVDFADVRAVMQNMGDALMGTGIAEGEYRAAEAAQSAICSPLLEGISIAGSQGVLINIAASSDLKMTEVDEAMQVVYAAVGKDTNTSNTNIIFGVVLDETLADQMMVTVIATGFNKAREAANTESKIKVSTPQLIRPQTQQQRAVQTDRTPVGPDELEKYEAPAYMRRNVQLQHGGFDITRLREQTETPEEIAASNEQKQNQEPEQEMQTMRRQASATGNEHRPAFLRRIMD